MVTCVFVGAVEGSLVALNALHKAEIVPGLTVTLPPEAAHRHSDFADLTTPALKAGGAVHHTTNINADATLEAVAAVRPDLVLVIGWSQICKQPFRDIARMGTVGFHPSALPKMRGRAVIPWTILIGEPETGSTLFWIDEGTDSGPILIQRRVTVAKEETARTLYEKHTRNLGEMIVEAVRLVESGKAPSIIQDHSKASYCAKRTADDGMIDWHQPALSVLRLIRAVGDPYPGAFTLLGDERIIVDEARAMTGGPVYIGISGQVQAHTPQGFLVLCGDGRCIEVTSCRGLSGGRPRVHARLRGFF